MGHSENAKAHRRILSGDCTCRAKRDQETEQTGDDLVPRRRARRNPRPILARGSDAW